MARKFIYARNHRRATYHLRRLHMDPRETKIITPQNAGDLLGLEGVMLFVVDDIEDALRDVPEIPDLQFLIHTRRVTIADLTDETIPCK